MCWPLSARRPKPRFAAKAPTSDHAAGQPEIRCVIASSLDGLKAGATALEASNAQQYAELVEDLSKV
jgi:hypothetical protein